MRVPRRRVASLGLFLAALLLSAAVVNPGRAAAAPPSDLAAPFGQRSPRTCEELQPMLRQVELPDTRLMTALPQPGGAGVGACVFLDQLSGRPNVWLLSATSVDQFRATKATMGALLTEAQIDACALTFWGAVTSTVQRGLNWADVHDAGRPCEPVVEARGPQAEARRATVQQALEDAMRVAQARLGWQLTWPLHIQIWDDSTGIRNRGQTTFPSVENAAGEAGVTIVGSYTPTRIVLDLSQTPNDDMLRAVVAHEYGHIVQHGITGCTCNLPFWAVEGGAEYVASLVIGPRTLVLADRFQEARERVRTGAARPLASLADRRTAEALQPYSRGYAAFQFLTERWGEAAFAELYRRNFDGTSTRYHAALAEFTGLRLDEFDAALSEWLQGHPGFTPQPGPSTRLESGNQIFVLAAGRLIDDSFSERTAFTGTDPGVEIRVRWNCLEAGAEVSWTVYAPDGAAVARYQGQARAGCFSGSYISIALDERLGGPAPRSRLGEWRAQVSLDGVLQGAVTFTILP